jgi:hypothetical protein
MMRRTIWDNIIMNSRLSVCALLLACSGLASAQFTADDPDWKEADVPPPPAFDLKRLMFVEFNSASQLKWGVDPASIKISSDGIIRYVVVAQSPSGAVNAMYEGIRCNKAEFRRYARHHPTNGWVNATDSNWTALRQSSLSKHPLALAKLGLCDGAAAPSSADHAIRALRAGVKETAY